MITIINEDPLLYFNFKSTNKTLEPVQFKKPLKIITTHEIDQVIPCLIEVQDAVNNGFYAAGYLSYEAAPAFNNQLAVHHNNQIPLLWFGIFNEPISEERDEMAAFKCTKWEPTVPKSTYHQAIRHIHEEIKQGETEQVNYTIKMKSIFAGDPFSFFKQMEEAQSANYAAYLNIGSHTMMSASPELFFQLEDGIITTKPMKGTVERGKTYREDIEYANWLKNSPKNRTENELITTLIRSELNKLAIPNTVETTKQFEIEKYPTLYQMTSTVSATVLPEYDLTDIFKVLFPAGSITGSPKESTMEIIKTLETEPREVYCGAIGYITPDKDAIFSVPIRTVLLDNKTNTLEYGVGGGITIDSDAEEEYNEVFTKAKLLTKERTSFQLLESIGLKNGKWIVLDLHLNRLINSAKYFDFTLPLAAIQVALNEVAESHQDDHWKVRLLVSKNGDFAIDVEPVLLVDGKINVKLAERPIDKNNAFFYHKTTYRTIYDEHKPKDGTVYDVLLWNEALEVTEFTIGNIVINLNDKLITPPIESGLLPGTFREKLLDEGIISEQIITKVDLLHAKDIWLVNSVREWVLVNLVT